MCRLAACFCLLLVSGLIIHSAPPENEAPPELKLPRPESRTWVDASGKNSVVAKLVNFNETHIELERADSGQRITLSKEQLSKADQIYVAHATTLRFDQDAEIVLGKVSRVMDGDTILIEKLDGKNTTIRLEGVDAPETGQRFAGESKAWLNEQTAGKTVRAEITSRDRYGRTLANLYIGERWLNKELVTSGLAWHLVEYNKDVRLAEAQQEARGKKAGIWQDARRVAPWDYRNGQRVETAVPANVPSIRTKDETVFITETGTKYHRDGCRYLSKSKIEISLSRAKSAYQPCKVCKP